MQHANDHFQHFRCTEQYHRHSLAKIYFYTDGVKALADHCQCYWLIDVILCHQLHASVRAQDFQVWSLKRIQDYQFQVLATDGNDNKIVTQKIPFSDFPYDTAVIWLTKNFLLLPSEY